MLIDYSERAYQLLNRPLQELERQELYDVFYRLGDGMQIPDLPINYEDWKQDRQSHLERDLVRSKYTDMLFERYRQQLGGWPLSIAKTGTSAISAYTGRTYIRASIRTYFHFRHLDIPNP